MPCVDSGSRTSLLDFSRQLDEPSAALSSELLARTHFLWTTDMHSRLDIIWANIWATWEAQWSLIRVVLIRWQAQTDHFILGCDLNAIPSIWHGYSLISAAHAADSLLWRFTKQLSLQVCQDEDPRHLPLKAVLSKAVPSSPSRAPPVHRHFEKPLPQKAPKPDTTTWSSELL
jgi:hypothetical protein